MTDLNIRSATLDDLKVLVAFQTSMAMETEGRALDGDTVREGIKGVFQQPERGFYLVAEADRRVVGSLLVTYEWSDWRNASFWWVQSVYVDSGWRRRGVYSAMHSHVHKLATSRGDVCGIRLYVDHENHVAQQTYASLGMTRARYHMYEIDFVL